MVGKPRLFWLGLVVLFLVLPGIGSGERVESQAQSRNKGGVNATLKCAPLAPPTGSVLLVSSVNQLVQAVNNAATGSTILIADGYYNLNGAYLRFETAGVTLRSASGEREAVILDGNYSTTEIIQIVASTVTIADLTLREAYYHPIHVMSADDGHTLNTLIYNVHIIDPGEQAIKINPAAAGFYADNGEIACSRIELTDTGRPHIRNNCYTGGIDAHQARGWVIRDNHIEGFWCTNGLSEHGIHMWRGCRDTLIERNTLVNNARGIGFGLVTSGSGRTYTDNPCPSASGYVDDFGGTIRNNFVFANNSGLFNSQSGFDCGVCLWNACNGLVVNNTVYSTQAPFSSIEWRFENTNAMIGNNLANYPMRQRDGASATQFQNLTTAEAGWFVNSGVGNLHLVPSANAAIDQAVSLVDVLDDIDGDARPSGAGPDIGADELVAGLHLSAFAGNATIHLNWNPSIAIAETVTWRVSYFGPVGDQPSPISGLPSATRSYTLTGLTNYFYYPVLVEAVQGSNILLVGEVTVMPSDRAVFLPLTAR